MLAIWLEARLSKEQILTLYLNRVYLGAGAYGVEAASQRYFGKPAGEVTLAEAALLAGLLKAPSRYAPTGDLAWPASAAAIVLAAHGATRGSSTSETLVSARAPTGEAGARGRGSSAAGSPTGCWRA